MQKKIIALAVAGLMSGAAFAQSNVTIYGVMHASYDSIDTDINGQDRLRRITSDFSRIGFKGTEALGNGLAANWQLEQGVNLDQDGNATTAAAQGFNTRNTFVGLSSKTLGEVRFGHHDTPYKMSTGSLDVFGDTAGDYNSIIGSWNGARASFDKRATSTALYLSPMWNGLQVTAHYGHDNENGNNRLSNPSNWGLAGTYANGPLFASLAYERHNVGDVAAATASCINNTTGAFTTVAGGTCPSGTTSLVTGATAANDYKVKGTKLGLGYTFMGTTKVGFIYEHLSSSNNSNTATNGRNADRNAFGLNVAHTMGAVVLKAAYLRAGDSDRTGAINDGAKNWTLGADYNMSKRTQVYALYTKTNNDRNAYYGLGHGGHEYVGASTSAGKDPSAFSFGLKHSF